MISKTQTKLKSDAIVGPEDWKGWVKYLRKRRKPLAVHEVIKSEKISSLKWGLASFDRESTGALIDELFCVVRESIARKNLGDTLNSWLAAIPSEADQSFAAECLAWSHALPHLVDELGEERWADLLDTLIQIARDSAAISLDSNPLVNQMLSAELPLTLSYQFPEIQRCSELAGSATASLSQAASDLLDGRGLPHARNLGIVRPLLVCWTRCGLLGNAAKRPCFNEIVHAQFEWLIRQSFRLSTHDGSQVFFNAPDTRWNKRFFEAALTLSDDNDDKAIAAQALRGFKSTTSTQSKCKDRPKSAYHSEWAQTAMLRASWSRKSELLAVTYDESVFRSELRVGAATIWSGRCNPVIRVNKSVLEPESEWEQVCWHSDQDVDYLELEMEYRSGWKLQRQVLLAREDRFLFLADAVIGADSSQIEYRRILPLVGEVQLNAAEETRDGLLYNEQRLATVMPLALPEWRTESTDDRLEQTDCGLELCQHQFGAAHYAPLFIDLKPSRFSKELTWRQLTVADRLETQSRDIAVGYRVQIGKAQWLIYRSLSPPANRTVLGQNLTCEFFLGRFTKNGATKELLQIN